MVFGRQFILFIFNLKLNFTKTNEFLYRMLYDREEICTCIYHSFNSKKEMVMLLAKERLAYIVNRLKVRPSISIQELSKEMDVSLSTVQRDLRKLDKTGKIERSRGGALSNHVSSILSDSNEISVLEKIHINEKEKELIAAEAAKYIKDGDCIFLDSGTTIAYLVPYIMGKKITIVTNSLYLQKKLIGYHGNVYILGGMYNTKFDVTMGATAIAELENMQFNRAFLSVNGIDIKKKELYCADGDIAHIKRMVVQRSKENYVLLDHTKFDIKAMNVVGKTSDYKAIFTDDFVSDDKKPRNLIICK